MGLLFNFLLIFFQDELLFNQFNEEIEDEDTGDISWGIAPTQLIAHLVASVKELKGRIEVLEGN